ncbi:MAG: VWA domain-containing protein [Alphaproteobacteria bacterium]|nr:VWA domain-containing protein [Alphaproteobacteria bacterium]
MTKREPQLPVQSGTKDVDDFLQKVATTRVTKAAGSRGRLMFAIDATASREPTWDMACHLQSEMFEETAALGGLDVKLVYYRGFGECRTSPWVSNSHDLVDRMNRVTCLGGRTQIRKVLRHAMKETRSKPVDALVFVGDCVEEDVDRLCHIAGELGLLGVRVFVFHEGGELSARRTFEQIAQLTGGAYCPFDAGSARQLRTLLSAVAVYAAGGRTALEDFSRKHGDEVRRITHQIK